MRKAVVLDIDGTLLNSEKKITDKTRKALIKLQKKGHILVLASGRPTSAMLKLAEQLEMKKHHGLLVSYNGSKVIDCESDEVLFNETLKVEEGKAVLEHLKKFDVIPMLEDKDYLYVNDVYNNKITWKEQEINIIEYEARGGQYLLCEKQDLAKHLNYEVNKILVAGQPEYLKAHYKEIEGPFKTSLSCMFTADFYFEFTAKGIDKAKALKSVLHTKDIGAIIAFGDGLNDLSMLTFADIAIAMGNAVDELKQIADKVTLTNDEDGIAYALQELFDLS